MITHNRGVVNRHYLERVPSATEKVGDLLNLEPTTALKELSFVIDSVFVMDRRAQEKFGIQGQWMEFTPSLV